MKVLIAGGTGNVGRGIHCYLCRSGVANQVGILSRNAEAFRITDDGNAVVKTTAHQLDLNAANGALAPILKDYDLVVNAAPLEFNQPLMAAAVEGGCHYIDLGGYTESQREWGSQFVNNGRLALLCMGACPGISNVMAALGCEQLDEAREIHIRVGSRRGEDFKGLNINPKTLIEEFTRPPVVYEQGEHCEVPPLSGRQTYTLASPVGPVEGFYAHHSEVLTLPEMFPQLQTVTYRVSFPEAVMSIMDVLGELGLLTDQPIQVRGVSVTPIEFLELALKGHRHAGNVAQEHKSLQVSVVGEKKGRPAEVTFELVAGSNAELGLIASSYWTSVPVVVAIEMLAAGEINAVGVKTPEEVLPPQRYFSRLKPLGLEIQVNAVD